MTTVTDISEFDIPAGKVYRSPVIDCFDGKVVSRTIGMRPDAQLVNTMLDAAIETIDISSNRPVVHSDRGAHYRWPGWLARIADAELTLKDVDGLVEEHPHAGYRIVLVTPTFGRSRGAGQHRRAFHDVGAGRANQP